MLPKCSSEANPKLKLKHVELFQPICPRCKSQRPGDAQPLTLQVLSDLGEEGYVEEGLFQCPSAECGAVYPILGGIPFLMPQVQSFVNDNITTIMSDKKYAAPLMNLIGEFCNQGSQYETMRQHISCYAWDHYGLEDPSEVKQPSQHRPGNIVRLLEKGLELLKNSESSLDRDQQGLILDIGCGVGRTTWELANRTSRWTLGLDLHLPMLKMAHQVLRDKRVRYELRRTGLIYELKDFPFEQEGASHIDFWACDAMCLPFPDHSVDQCVALNVLDCVSAPSQVLREVANVTKDGSQSLFSTPYDWTAQVTPQSEWIGGTSHRSHLEGDARSTVLRFIEQYRAKFGPPTLELLADCAVFPWLVRLHERSFLHYDCHLFTLMTHAAKAE